MPTTFEALTILLIFGVPAYLAIRVFRARYPILYYRAKQSTLAEASLYAFLGAMAIVSTVLSLALLGLIAAHVRNLFPAGAAPSLNAATSPIGGPPTVAVFIIISYYATGIPISCVIGVVVPRILPKEPLPLWFNILFGIGIRQTTAGAWLLMQLKNKDRCLGLVSEVRWIGDEDCTMELTLDKVFYRQAGSRVRQESVGRVVLRTDDILWLSPYWRESRLARKRS